MAISDWRHPDLSLEDLVGTFQRAFGDENCGVADELYGDIETRCRKVASDVAAQFRWQLGTEIDDAMSDVLVDCCRKFPRKEGQRFLGYFRVAAVNRAIQLVRRKRLGKTTVLQQEPVQEESDDTDCEEFSRQMAVYCQRKRRLLDQIAIKSQNRRATMLLDQRHRMTAAVAGSNCVSAICRSTWVADHERWTSSERQIPADSPRGTTTSQVWAVYADRSDACHTKMDQSLMLEAIGLAGLSISPVAWRQRIARYLREVHGQVDEEEWRYFHAKA